MTQPRKIRVLYFDESPATLIRFVESCGCKEIIDILGAFHSFAEIAPMLEQDNYCFFSMLAVDVVVLKIDSPDSEVGTMLQKLKKHCRVKLIGLLSNSCIEDRRIVGSLDYYTPQPGADDMMTDEDSYNRLIYQIKTARLALNTQRAGVRGKWAVLPVPPKIESHRRFDLIAIGASTGGTEAVSKILSAMRADMPPIVVVQHILDMRMPLLRMDFV